MAYGTDPLCHVCNRTHDVCECAPAAKPMTHEGWRIGFDPPPIPIRSFDWWATHPEYDGPGDNRHFRAATYEELIFEIDEWIAENT